MQLSTRLSETFGRLGPVTGVAYLISRGLNRVFGDRVRLICYGFVAQPVSPATAPGRASAKLVVRRAYAGDSAIAALPRPTAVVERRFRSGDVCLVAELDSRLVGCLWLAFGGYAEDEVRCHYGWQPPTAAAWDYDVYVAAEHRMSRVFARLWEAAHQFLRARGASWTLSRISRFNAESLAAHRRMGAREIAGGTFLVVGTFQCAFLSVPPYLWISLHDKNAPRIVLRTLESASASAE